MTPATVPAIAPGGARPIDIALLASVFVVAACGLLYELVDGRVALLEYKGDHIQNPYQTEKHHVGALWAQASAGKAVFGWLTRQQDGKSLAQQLDTVLA